MKISYYKEKDSKESRLHKTRARSELQVIPPRNILEVRVSSPVYSLLPNGAGWSIGQRPGPLHLPSTVNPVQLAEIMVAGLHRGVF